MQWLIIINHQSSIIHHHHHLSYKIAINYTSCLVLLGRKWANSHPPQAPQVPRHWSNWLFLGLCAARRARCRARSSSGAAPLPGARAVPSFRGPKMKEVNIGGDGIIQDIYIIVIKIIHNNNNNNNKNVIYYNVIYYNNT